MLAEDADEDSVTRSLEAYLLWLFGYVMFTNAQGTSVDKVLLPYAQEIADGGEEDIMLRSWGSAVLAATYHGLCVACRKRDENALLTGCPLLLQLWSYERFSIGRPIINHSPYDYSHYGQEEDERPTMATIWMSREVCTYRLHTFIPVISSKTVTILQRTWAHVQVRRAYAEFSFEFDNLRPDCVVWEPYSAAAVAARAPYGLSPVCTQGQHLWMTRTALVYDIYVESYCPDRVMRQFGRRQMIQCPPASIPVPRREHRYCNQPPLHNF
jgi:Plant mobile domain